MAVIEAEKPEVINPFSVSINSSGQKCVIDLRYVNTHVYGDKMLWNGNAGNAGNALKTI